jgi:hypothetical protein
MGCATDGSTRSACARGRAGHRDAHGGGRRAAIRSARLPATGSRRGARRALGRRPRNPSRPPLDGRRSKGDIYRSAGHGPRAGHKVLSLQESSPLEASQRRPRCVPRRTVLACTRGCVVAPSSATATCWRSPPATFRSPARSDWGGLSAVRAAGQPALRAVPRRRERARAHRQLLLGMGYPHAHRARRAVRQRLPGAAGGSDPAVALGAAGAAAARRRGLVDGAARPARSAARAVVSRAPPPATCSSASARAKAGARATCIRPGARCRCSAQPR